MRRRSGSLRDRLTDALRLDGAVLAGAAVVSALFLLLEPAFYAILSTPRAAYEAPSLLVAAFGHSAAYGLGWGLSALALAAAPRRVWWRLPADARWLWLPAGAAVVVVAWHLGTLDANWVLGREYRLDRVLLVLVALGALLHPALLAAFAACALAFTGQLHVPGVRFGWLDTNVLYHALLIAFLGITAYAPGWRGRPVRWRGRGLGVPVASTWAVLLGVLAAWYLLPAIGKVRLDWLSENNLAHLLHAAYEQHGWLAWLGPERHAALGDSVRRWAVPMQAFGLAAESLVLFVFWSRRVAIGLLALCFALHAGIFAASGVFFWKWMVLLAAIAAAFWWMGEARWRRLFPRSTMLAAAVPIALGYALLGPRPSILAWYDTPLVYRFQIEVTGESGRRYEATPAAFAPFDSRFAQARFYALAETPRLVDCYGNTYRRHPYRALLAAETAAEVREIVERYGERRASPEGRAELEALFRRFLDATHERAARPPLDFGPVRAPLHLWTGQRHDARLPAYRHEEPLRRLEITLVHRHGVGSRYRVVSEERVLTVER
jgi:hypothetical protein